MKRALELSATALVLVHNHPSGDPTPSRADIQMTKVVIDVARPFAAAGHTPGSRASLWSAAGGRAAAMIYQMIYQ